MASRGTAGATIETVFHLSLSNKNSTLQREQELEETFSMLLV